MAIHALAAAAYRALRPLLFRGDAETVHERTMALLERAQRIAPARGLMGACLATASPRLEREVMGIRFPNPVGLAAGFDKNARVIHGMAALGFGFVEVGTVTRRPQPGNPKPRLFRLPEDHAVQNAMGFNNDGMEALRARYEAHAPYPIPVGINLGKNKDTPEEKALDDYAALFNGLAHLGDYFVVNISSPNTPGLRNLANEPFITRVFECARAATPKPVLLKIAPDGDLERLLDVCDHALQAGAAGLIATNTTIDYSVARNARDTGGLSGRVLREKSYTILSRLAERFDDRGALISVGGIDNGDEAVRRFAAGADLVQVYTGMVYEGPSLPGQLCDALLREHHGAN